MNLSSIPLLLLAFISILFSCNESPKSGIISKNEIVFDLAKSSDLGLKEAKNLNKEIIELSFSDSIVIPVYSNLMVSENDFIIYSQKTFQVFRFDMAGNFINFIGNRGGGPDEFIEMRDVILNRQNDNTIEILDHESILKYQMDGSFIKKTNIKYPAFSFAVDSNNYWFYIGNNPSFSQFKLIQTDAGFVQKNEYFKISEKGVPLVENNFSKGSHITFRESLSPNLYTLSDELNCSYNIDFGKYKIPDAILSSDPIQMIEKLEKIEYATIRAYLENKNYTFLLIMKYNPNEMFPDLYYWAIDKNTSEEKLIRIKDFVEESYLLYPQTISDNDMIYFVGYDIASEDEPINPNSNPSIIKMRIREFFDYGK